MEETLGGGDAPQEVVASCSKSPPSSEGCEVTGSEDVNAGNKYLATFQFDLVVEKTLSYLNFEDMKALSETCKTILDAVRNTRHFSNRARLNICKEVIQNGLLKECVILWKHVTFDLMVPVEAVDLIGDVLEGAESVYLKLPSGPSLDDERVAHYLEEVLRKTKNLKTLGLDAEIMNKVLHDVFSNVEIQQVMSNLQGLEIRNFSNPAESHYFIVGGADEDEETPFQRNFLQLSMVPLSLKSFLLGKVVSIVGSHPESDCVKFIPRIVESIKNTVEDLELHLHVWKFEEFKGIRCPRLKRLTLSTTGDDTHGKIVETFLKNQPPLEELDISLSNEFPVSILLTLQGMLMKMKKLHLKAKRFAGRSGPMDWEFLEDMTELKDFALRKPESLMDPIEQYGFGESILIKLPPTTQKISLQGFNPFWGYDRGNAEKNIGDLLARFENLKELNLLRSNGAVTDDGLQSIISNCGKLVSLTFSHCYDLTNYGISGVHPRKDGEWADSDAEQTDTEGDKTESEKTGVSLDKLTGLVHLKIRSCPNVHYETLLHVVKFKCLRSFDYYRNVSLPKDFLYQIVRQNPCLESVALHMVSYDHDSDYLNELTKEVKQINSRVHLFELLEKTDWEQDDSDSDASSRDRGSGDSNFSGCAPGHANMYGFDADELNFDEDDSPHDYEDDYEYYDGDGDFDWSH